MNDNKNWALTFAELAVSAGTLAWIKDNNGDDKSAKRKEETLISGKRIPVSEWMREERDAGNWLSERKESENE